WLCARRLRGALPFLRVSRPVRARFACRAFVFVCDRPIPSIHDRGSTPTGARTLPDAPPP
ncbi:unnamed protein product, partial [Arctia plantaginis]